MSCSDTNFQYYCSRLQRQVYFNYYDLLQLNCYATEEDIKKAYRALARKYHPDRCIDSSKEISQEKFKFISDAYTNLIDPIKRAAYDQFLLQMDLRQKVKRFDIQGISSMLQSCQQGELINLLAQSFKERSNQFWVQQNYQQTQQQDQMHSNTASNEQFRANCNDTRSCDNLDNISEGETDEQQQQQYPSNSCTFPSTLTASELAFYEKFPSIRPSNYSSSASFTATDLNNQTTSKPSSIPIPEKHQSNDDSAETVLRTPLTKSHILHLQKSSQDRKLIHRIRSKKSIFSAVPILKKSIAKHLNC